MWQIRLGLGMRVLREYKKYNTSLLSTHEKTNEQDSINEGRDLYLYMKGCAAVTCGTTHFTRNEQLPVPQMDTIHGVSVGHLPQHPISSLKGDHMNLVPYAYVFVSFMCIMVATRLDITHAAGHINRFVHNPVCPQ